MAVSANRLELLQIADAVAREKSIDRMIVIASMQDAIEKAAKTRYGAETNVRAEINPRTGEIYSKDPRQVSIRPASPALSASRRLQASNSAHRSTQVTRAPVWAAT